MPNYTSNNGTFHRNSSSYVEGGRNNFREIGDHGEIEIKGSKIKNEVLKPVTDNIPHPKKDKICKDMRKKLELTKEISDIKRNITNSMKSGLEL